MEEDISLIEIKNGYLIKDYEEHLFKNYIRMGSCYIRYGEGNLLIHFYGTAFPSNYNDKPHIENAYIENIFGVDESSSFFKKECLNLLEKEILSFPHNQHLSKVNFKITEKHNSNIFPFLEKIEIFPGALFHPVLNHSLPFTNH